MSNNQCTRSAALMIIASGNRGLVAGSITPPSVLDAGCREERISSGVLLKYSSSSPASQPTCLAPLRFWKRWWQTTGGPDEVLKACRTDLVAMQPV